MIIRLLFLLFCAWSLLGAPAKESTQAQEHADKGRQSAQIGDLKHAEAELRLALEKDPHNAVYLGSLGAILGMEQKLEESNVYLKKALEIDPTDLATRRNLASNQFQLGQLQPAKENLERLLKAQPGDPMAVLLLGMIAEESKDYVTASKILEAARSQVRQRPESIAALVRAYYHTGQKDKARQALRELEELPAAAEGVFLGAQVAAQAGDYETATGMFSSIWSTYPDTAKLGYSLALAQYHANRIQESHATLRKLLSAGYETSDIYNLVGWCFYRESDSKQAVAAMDKAIALDPSRESNYLDVGMMLIELRRYEGGALVAAQKALEVAPNSSQAYRLKGLAYLKLYDFREAVRAYARAVELNPDDRESLLGLASVQKGDGKIQQAEATFKKGIERFPRDAVFYQEYGKMLLIYRRGRDPTAESRGVSLLQTALALDGSLPEPHYQLGRLALSKGRTQEALQQLEAAAKLNPKISKIHYALANAYRKLSRPEDAAKEFQIYMSLKAEEEQSASGKPAGGTRTAEPEEDLIPTGVSQGPRHD